MGVAPGQAGLLRRRRGCCCYPLFLRLATGLQHSRGVFVGWLVREIKGDELDGGDSGGGTTALAMGEGGREGG